MVEVNFLFLSENNSVLQFCLNIVLDQHIDSDFGSSIKLIFKIVLDE